MDTWEGSSGVEVRRKSARISALKEVKKYNAFFTSDDNNLDDEDVQNETQTTPRTPASGVKRGRKCKRLTDVVGLPSPQQDCEGLKPAENSNNGEPDGGENQLPAKRVLEFILKTLQRIDIRNAFAQPVDPQKVWSYQSIIKEPMDFGTIRSKLDQGMYTNLEQFQYDVDQVSKNAMYFNASKSQNYLDAEGIQDTARRLFQDLKADPHSFQLRYLQKRREPAARRGQRATRGRPRRPRGTTTSTRRRTNQTDSNPQVAQDHNEISPETRDGRDSNLGGTQRRRTYCMPSNDKESLFLSVYNASKPLVHVDGGIGYGESLISFSKGLGPIAQRVAKRKLSEMEALNRKVDTTSNAVGANGGPMTQMLLHSLSAPARAGNEAALGGMMNTHVESNHSDRKGKMIMQPKMGQDIYNKPLQQQMGIDINRNLDMSGLTNDMGHHCNDRMVRLESHIRVVKDGIGSGNSGNRLRFRTVDMLGRPKLNLGNRQQLLPQAPLVRIGPSLANQNQSRLMEIMSRTNTYLRPSSYLPSPAPKFSSLSEVARAFHGFGSQPTPNYAANSAFSATAGLIPQQNNIYVTSSGQAAHLPPVPRWSQPNTAQGLQDMINSIPIPNMNNVNRFGHEYHNQLAKNMFMRQQQQQQRQQEIMKQPPPFYNAIGAQTHQRAATSRWHQNEPTSQSLLSLLVDSQSQQQQQQPNLALQL